MAPVTPPVKTPPPPPPPPPKVANGAPPVVSDPGAFSVSSGVVGGAKRIVIYGPGGIGKSTLANLAPNPITIDIEDGTRELNVTRLTGVGDLQSLRACLHSNALDQYSTIIIDSATRAEEWAIAHTLATVQNERGSTVTSIEGYGYGKGYQHVYDTFLLLMSDLDHHVRQGRNVILIAHDCTADVPNPVGDDYIRYEPHLQGPKSGRASIRNRVIQWADYVLFVGYDVAATKDGKGKGGGTRTIFAVERPDHIAKSRTTVPNIQFKNETDNAIWLAINGGKS